MHNPPEDEGPKKIRHLQLGLEKKKKNKKKRTLRG